MIQAVCFDMFDTLADARRHMEQSESDILGITPEDWGAVMWEKELCRDRGLGVVKTVREMIDRACDALPFPVSDEQRQAVEAALALLGPGGVLVICAYPGHPEGDREREALQGLLRALPPQRFNALRQHFLNAGPGAPECFVIQRQGAENHRTEEDESHVDV